MLPTVLRRRSWCYSYCLCGFVDVYYWPFHVESCLALCSRVVFSQSCLTLRSPRLGKRELVYVLLLLLFVYFARVKFCHFHFLLVSGVGCDLCLWHSLDFLIYLLYLFIIDFRNYFFHFPSNLKVFAAYFTENKVLNIGREKASTIWATIWQNVSSGVSDQARHKPACLSYRS